MIVQELELSIFSLYLPSVSIISSNRRRFRSFRLRERKRAFGGELNGKNVSQQPVAILSKVRNIVRVKVFRGIE